MTRQSGHLNGQNTKIFEGQMKTGARGQRASVFPVPFNYRIFSALYIS